MRQVVATIKADSLGVFVFVARKYYGGKFTSFDAASVDALRVFTELQTAHRVVAVDDGGAISLWEKRLIFIPNLEKVTVS